jgi:hypothetical protein
LNYLRNARQNNRHFAVRCSIILGVLPHFRILLLLVNFLPRSHRVLRLSLLWRDTGTQRAHTAAAHQQHISSTSAAHQQHISRTSAAHQQHISSTSAAHQQLGNWELTILAPIFNQ